MKNFKLFLLAILNMVESGFVIASCIAILVTALFAWRNVGLLKQQIRDGENNAFNQLMSDKDVAFGL